MLAEVTNVSSGGFLCQLSHPISVGTPLELRINILQQTGLVAVEAVVRNIRETAPGEYAIGLEITEVAGLTVRGFMASLEAMFS